MFPINDKLSEADRIFAANVTDMMPEYKALPEEYAQMRHPWCQFASGLFFKGGDLRPLVAKPGVDKDKAIRHISTVLRSWEPKHEHKIGAVGFLFNEWFEGEPPKETK